MKRLIVLLFAFFVVLTTHARAAESWVLLIGVSNYQNPGITSLRFPAADVTAVRDTLIDPKFGNLPEDHVRLLADEDATAVNINAAVDDFLAAKVQPGDKVILFLAGHGVTKGVGANAESYFLPSDATGLSSTALDASAVNLKVLSAKLSQLPAAQFVVFVDACRDDPAPGRGVKGNALTDVLSRGLEIVPAATGQTASVVSFFACGIGQRAYEDPGLQHGVFTYWILDAIRQAAVPQPPDGAIDMGRLASYVRAKVEEWTRQASQGGNFDISQTPEIVTTELSGPVILMNVQRPLADATVPLAPPSLRVLTYPEDAGVSLNGQRLGVAPLSHTLQDSGEYTLKIEAAGYQPVERKIQVFSGYDSHLEVRMQPAAAASPASGQANEYYQRAVDAETRQQWEAARAGYGMVLRADPKFQPAYERLADLRMRQGAIAGGVAVLVDMAAAVPQNARALSKLARAFAKMAEQGLGDTEGVELGRKKGAFSVPRKPEDAGKLALQAANAAIKIEPDAAASQVALGFALIATDDKGKNRNKALEAFGQALFIEPKDAENHFGMGYGIRRFAQQMTEGGGRDAELKRAVVSLQAALELRPDFYEAHRELAYCHHLLDDNQAAIRQYEVANAHRGEASDPNEVASTDVALASLHQEEANNATGEDKTAHQEASDGYLEDAREIDPDLKQALRILGEVGLNTRVSSFLPPELQRLMNLPNNLENEIKGSIRDRIRLPF